MSLPARILAALVCAVALLAVGFRFGVRFKQAEWDAATVEAQREAATTREKNDAELAKQNQAHADQVRAINRRLADALERLRERPERMPDSSRAACEGGTGAELSRPDAGFLEREAARADELRSALSTCYAWIDQVRSK